MTRTTLAENDGRSADGQDLQNWLYGHDETQALPRVSTEPAEPGGSQAPAHSREETRTSGPFGLSFSQIVGGALAAMTAAFLGTKLGLSGTVLGAALASVSAAVLGTVFSHSIRRAREGAKTAIGRTPGQRTANSRAQLTAPRAAVKPAKPMRPGRLVYIAIVLGVIGLMLSFGGILGVHLAESLSPYLGVTDLKRYAHHLAKVIRTGR